MKTVEYGGKDRLVVLETDMYYFIECDEVWNFMSHPDIVAKNNEIYWNNRLIKLRYSRIEDIIKMNLYVLHKDSCEVKIKEVVKRKKIRL